MLLEHNSVASHLKEKIPHIFLMGYICHSAYLSASHTCDTAGELISDVYNYFSRSAKRQAGFRKFQLFMIQVELHQLLLP